MCRAIPLILCLILFSGDPGAFLSQQIFPERRVPPSDFVIMAWGPTPPDALQIQGMKEAGINVAGFTEIRNLGLFEQQGMQVLVSDPRISGYDFSKPLDLDVVRKNIQAVAREIGTSPAVVGFFLYDEPQAKLFSGLGEVAKIIQEFMPGKWVYVNLLPSRASKEYMGTPNYESYVQKALSALTQPFLSYDNYSLVQDRVGEDFYQNLAVIREQALKANIPFWNCILSNAHFDYMENTEATYHLQVYATLAYGGRGIEYFSYFTWPLGNFRGGPIDPFGNKTSSWDMLRRINNEIHVLTPTLKQLRSTGVYHEPALPAAGKPLAESPLIQSLERTRSHQFSESPSGDCLIGEFVDEKGRPYLMIVNKDLKNSLHFNVKLKNEKSRLIHISPYSGQEENPTEESLWLAPGAGELFRVN